MSVGDVGRFKDVSPTGGYSPRSKTEKPETPTAAESYEPAKGEEKAWTFLFYNVGQGNLSTMATHAVSELERVGSDENTHVVALNYRERPAHEKWLGRNEQFEGAHAYYVTRHDKSSAARWLGNEMGSLLDGALASPREIASEVIGTVAGAGDAAKMSQAETLKAFLLENMKRYPARHFALVLTGHGAAFQGQAISRGPEGRAALSNDAIAGVLDEVARTGQGIDLVNLNTCYSANLETVYSLKDSTRAIVASQDALALGTQPFGAVLNEMQKQLRVGDDVGPQQLAQMFVEQAKAQPLSELYSPTLSAFETSRLEAVGGAVAQLQAACQKNGVAPEEIRRCLSEAVSISFAREPRPVQLTDLGSLAAVIGERVASKEVREAARAVSQALEKSLLAEQHSGPEDQGMLSKLVRRIPMLVGPQADLDGATGMTVFWDAQESKRLEMIAGSSYGKAHPLTQFMAYLAG